MEKIAGAGQNNPLFRQVYEFMLNRMERGEWKTGDKLPSIRLLAEELGVHRLTVFKAYRALAESGKLYVKDKSGYYVAPGSRLNLRRTKGRQYPDIWSGARCPIFNVCP